MAQGVIQAEFQILFHPDLTFEPIEVAILYSFNGGRNWDEYFTNKITAKNWQVQMFDLPINGTMDFFLRAVNKDGRIVLIKKNEKNYRIAVRDNTNTGMYKAQIRITEENIVPIGRRCLVCEQVIPKGKNMCQTPQCNAVFCPDCNRMLPPYSNYCPWDKKAFQI